VGFTPGRLTARRDLPALHSEIWGLDLATNRTAALVLNLAALPVLIFVGWIFVSVASLLRPGLVLRMYLFRITPNPYALMIVILVFIVAVMTLHEAIHGAFFWLFTRSKPVFGMNLLFAYAGTPDWYIPRNQYVIIGLAPLVLITTFGFVAIFMTSLAAAQLSLLGMTLNAAGAIGDIYVSGKVLGQPPDVLIRDTGAGFTIFGHTNGGVEHRAEGVISHER